MNAKYGTEQERISKFIKLRRIDIETLFLKDNISDKEIEALLYGMSQSTDNQLKTNNTTLKRQKRKS
jgi:hypothetical protein